jgi:hypothetical protein
MGSPASPFLKKLVLGLLLALLLLPAVQAKWPLFAVRPLSGYAPPAPHPTLDWPGLRASTYQPRLEQYITDQLGFREDLIRLRNQLGYSIFQESPNNRLAVGQHDMLFEREYLDAYLGTDFVGEAQVQFHVRRLRAVQDTLARHGVQLVFVIAPSKATFMPENLPGWVQRQPRARTNYQAYAQALPAAGVHTLDFSQAFQRWKPRAAYPLFPPGGTHWSMYGGALAADSLRRYVQQVLHVQPAPFRLVTSDVTTTPRESDDDISKGMNLLTPPAGVRLAYPTLEYAPLAPGQTKPNALLIGDSFGWIWIADKFFPGSFNEASRYWYYNLEVGWPGPEATPEGRDMGQLKRREQYLARQVIILLFNERNLVGFDKGFSDEVYTIYKPYTDAEKARHRVLTDSLRQHQSWEESLQDGAEQRLGQRAQAIIDLRR